MFKKVITVIALALSFCVLTGSALPSFNIETIQGDILRSDDLLEKGIIYLDFWSTSCQPCLRLLPHISNLVEKYPDVSFIAVSIDSPRNKNNVLRLVRSQKFEFITGFDANKSLQKLFNVTSIPRSIIIDKSGKIVYDHTGFNSGDEKKIEDEIIKALKGE